MRVYFSLRSLGYGPGILCWLNNNSRELQPHSSGPLLYNVGFSTHSYCLKVTRWLLQSQLPHPCSRKEEAGEVARVKGAFQLSHTFQINFPGVSLVHQRIWIGKMPEVQRLVQSTNSIYTRKEEETQRLNYMEWPVDPQVQGWTLTSGQVSTVQGCSLQRRGIVFLRGSPIRNPID